MVIIQVINKSTHFNRFFGKRSQLKYTLFSQINFAVKSTEISPVKAPFIIRPI